MWGRKLKYRIIALTMAILFLPWSYFVYAEPEYESIVKRGSLSLDADMEVDNLALYGYEYDSYYLKLNGHTLIIHGQMVTSNISISFDGGQIICENDAKITGKSVAMTDINDSLVVNGNLILSTSENKIASGKIEVKGDVSVKGSTVFKNNELILSGDKEQIVYQEDDCRFAKVIVKNYSEDGITISNAFNYESLVDNSCHISFVDDTRVVGTKLVEDKVYSCDVYLSSGMFDLNGHNVVIMGNLIQEGGTLCLNGGSLKIGGD